VTHTLIEASGEKLSESKESRDCHALSALVGPHLIRQLSGSTAVGPKRGKWRIDGDAFSLMSRKRKYDKL